MVHTFSDSFVPSLNAVWIIPRFIFSPPPPRHPPIFLLIFSPTRRPLVRLQSWTLSNESWAFKVSDEFFSSSLYTAVSPRRGKLTGAGRYLFSTYAEVFRFFLHGVCLVAKPPPPAHRRRLLAPTASAFASEVTPATALIKVLLKKRVTRVQVSVKQHVFSFGPHVSRPSLLLQQILSQKQKYSIHVNIFPLLLFFNAAGRQIDFN